MGRDVNVFIQNGMLHDQNGMLHDQNGIYTKQITINIYQYIQNLYIHVTQSNLLRFSNGQCGSRICYSQQQYACFLLNELKNKGTTIKLKNDLVRFDQFNDIVELSKYSKLEKRYAK